MKKILFSGIQPNNLPTIGHIGILEQWLYFQNKYNCFYCIVDLHSLTSKRKSFSLKKNILDLISIILAYGINPNKSILFLQSSVVEHVKLYWILNCFTYFGELKRMTHFRNKYMEQKNSNIGLFSYPVLMASDILLYKSNYVAVGLDQIQHIEFTRNIANRFNNLHSYKIFNIPKYILPIFGSKIMSLLEPNKKMSKSDINMNNVIFLLDDLNLIKHKIINSITDSDNPSIIKYDILNKPGISNLLNILSLVKKVSVVKLEKKFINYSYQEFKKIVSNELCLFLSKLQKKYFFFRKKERFLYSVLLKGSLKAHEFSKISFNEISKLIGLFYK